MGDFNDDDPADLEIWGIIDHMRMILHRGWYTLDPEDHLDAPMILVMYSKIYGELSNKPNLIYRGDNNLYFSIPGYLIVLTFNEMMVLDGEDLLAGISAKRETVTWGHNVRGMHMHVQNLYYRIMTSLTILNVI